MKNTHYSRKSKQIDFMQIMEEDYDMKLTDLVKAEFSLSENDKDFDLSHEQVIKVLRM